MPLKFQTMKPLHLFFIATLVMASLPLKAAKGNSTSVRVAQSAALAPDANEIDEPQFFVTEQYRDFLNREPDESGLPFWTSEITNCGSNVACIDFKRTNVSAAFFLSIEFQQTGFLVYRIYKASFNRMLRFEEFLPDTQQIGRNVVVNVGNWQQELENNKQQFVNGFVTRAAFTTKYPSNMTPEQYVDGLNSNTGNLLGQTTRDSLVNGLRANTETRASVLRKVAENSAFSQREFNPAFVLSQYFGYLRRNPDDAPDNNLTGFNFWLDKLNQFHGDYIRADMVKSFLVSGEYQGRFVTPPPVTKIISSAGGTVSQPGFAALTFPANSFNANTSVNLSATHTAETQADFRVTAQIFSAGLRTPFEVRINSGLTPPATSFDAVIQVPASFLKSMPVEAEIQAFAEVFQDVGEESLDSFEMFSSTFDPVAKTVRVTLPKEAFTNRRRVDELFEAIIVVGTTPTKPGTLSLSPEPTFLGNPSAFDIQFPSAPEIFNPDANCEGTSLGSPLQNPLVVTGAFNPPRHKGTDYRAATGDTVLAAADGKIKLVGNDSRPLPKPDPRSGKLIKGWGRYVLLEHADGSQTLYAHLVMDSVGKSDEGRVVKKGDPIAKANNSGGSSASHLHMEYAPNGKFFAKGIKVDPHPCIGTNVSGSITVRDNGTAADDAFRVSLDGTVLGTTAIGASNTFAVNNIRAGTHTLTIVCTIAPDDVGTYEVTLSQGLTFSGGGTSRSGTLTQGGTITFTINAPTT